MQPQINFLSQEEQHQIHDAALWLLENVGMQIPLPEATDIMRTAGARVGDNSVVRIPGELVAHAVEIAPKHDEIILYGREERYDVHLAKDTPVFCSMGGAIDVIDLETGERHPCRNKDLADIVRLMDGLENIGINGALATPQDVPKQTSAWYAIATLMKNTSKHFGASSIDAQGVRDVIRMASLAAGGEAKFRERPFISVTVLTRCPLQIDRLSLEALVEASRQGLPVELSSGPILGATSPVTIAGTLAQVHAEILAGLVLSQLVRPRTPFFYTCFARSMDMKSVNVSLASPEWSILKGASGQMGRYLGLPVKNPAFLRDAKILDAQAGFETGTTGLVSALAADIVHGLQYDMDTLIDFADLVFCNEAMGALKRIARGFPVDHNDLALDVIREVGHGGSFLTSKHTLQNFRKVLWTPRLMERRSWDQWDKDGRKDIKQPARQKAREILASHQPARLPAEVEAEIDKIAREAKVDYSHRS